MRNLPLVADAAPECALVLLSGLDSTVAPDRASVALRARYPKPTIAPGIEHRWSGDVLIELKASGGKFLAWLTTPWAGEHVEVPLPVANPGPDDFDRAARFALILSRLRADAEREGDTYKILCKSAR